MLRRPIYLKYLVIIKSTIVKSNLARGRIASCRISRPQLHLSAACAGQASSPATGGGNAVMHRCVTRLRMDLSDLDPIYYMVPWGKRHLDLFSRFLAQHTYTDRQTYTHATCDISSNRPYLCIRCGHISIWCTQLLRIALLMIAYITHIKHAKYVERSDSYIALPTR